MPFEGAKYAAEGGFGKGKFLSQPSSGTRRVPENTVRETPFARLTGVQSGDWGRVCKGPRDLPGSFIRGLTADWQSGIASRLISYDELVRRESRIIGPGAGVVSSRL